MKDAILETIIDTLSWYKTWQHSGYNHTHVKQKLPRKRRRAYKSSWSPRGNQKSFALTIHQNLAKFVKTYPGIIVTPWSAIVIRETYKISCLMGKTPHERRFGEPFEGPVIPFGSMVEYHSISAKDVSRQHQFGKKVLPGIFLGCVLYAEGIWTGDILVADIETDGRI